MHISMRRLIPALAVMTGAATAVLGLPASSAFAAPVAGSVIVQLNAEGSAPPGSNVITVTGHCPSGYRLVGSGAETSDSFTVITAMAPTGDFTGATLVAVVTQPPQNPPATADVFVLCAPATQFADVTISRTVYHGVRPGTFLEGIGRCPAGDYAFGGGGYFQTGGSNFLGASRDNATNAPSADGSAWTFAGVAPPSATELVVEIQYAPRTGHDFLMQFGNVSMFNGYTTSFATARPAGHRSRAGSTPPTPTAAWPGPPASAPRRRPRREAGSPWDSRR